MKFKEVKLLFRRNSNLKEGEVKSGSREKDLINEYSREGIRLGIFFNGMQQRVNQQPPVALFTDSETKTTFGVEPGQNIRSKLIETRKKFRSFKGRLERRKDCSIN